MKVDSKKIDLVKRCFEALWMNKIEIMDKKNNEKRI